MTFDLLVVGLDYLFLLASSSSLHIFRSGRILRLLRLIRTLRLARLVKMKKATSKFADASSNLGWTRVVIAVAVSNIFVMIFMVAHVAACLWYFLGATMDESWLDYNDFEHAPLGVQYARSLHWVLALMTTNTNDAVIGSHLKRHGSPSQSDKTLMNMTFWIIQSGAP